MDTNANPTNPTNPTEASDTPADEWRATLDGGHAGETTLDGALSLDEAWQELARLYRVHILGGAGLPEHCLLRRTPEPARTPRAALVSGGQGRRPREARQAAEAIVAAVAGGSIGMLAALVLGAAAMVVARLLWAWLGGPR